MKLIDADKYLEKVCTYKETGCGSCKLQTICPKDAITVEAIPVEWLKKHKYSDAVDLWKRECSLKDTEGILEELLSEHNFKSYNDYVEYAGKITALPQDDRLDILFKEEENETN